MKQIFTFLIVVLSIGLNAQQNQNQIIFSKATATWCPNCGTWGWGFMEGVKDEFKQNDNGLVLGVHYSGNLQNPTAQWWASNLNTAGQPQFYLNNEKVGVNSGNWNDKIAETLTQVEDTQANFNKVAFFNFVNAYINDDGDIEANLLAGPDESPTNDEYLGIYIFENNVEDVQSGLSGMQMHPNVLRDVIQDNPEGELFVEAGSIWTAAPAELRFTYPVADNWNVDNLGLLAVWWEKIDNSFIIKQATSIENIGTLSSISSTLDENLFSVINTESDIKISASTDDNYAYAIVSLSGKIVNRGNLNGELSISTDQWATGMYMVNIHKDGNYFTQKVFVK